MKVSLNWVKEYADVKGSVDEIAAKIGAQLGEVEEVVQWGPKYEGIVVVKVVSCDKHPNADKLSLCRIDDGRVVKRVDRGSDGLVQVVCGAPNVQAGMFAAWIPPGAVVPSTINKDPFTLEARDIRGQVSNGMLASLHELGISDDHSGILEIKTEDVGRDLARAGVSFRKLYGLDDYIIDIENKMFTHRPDCFGQLGVAREIAGIMHKNFSSPDWYVKENSFQSFTSSSVKGLAVDNQIPKLCRRYMAVVIDDILVGPSPVWLQVKLARVGIRPINNIVDMTNYIMMLTGQPLHAFDFDKVAVNGKAKIVIRNPKNNEKMTLLDGKVITPRPDAILICDQDKPIALGGVMGANNSEIDSDTKRIIIECANFDMYNIRKTSMEHGIFTDAVTRFNKGQSVLQCAPVLYKAVQTTIEVSAGAKPIGQTIDSSLGLIQNQSITASAEFINARLGTKLSLGDMSKLLANVEFKILSVPAGKKKLHIVPPFWRTDIEIPEDVVEEIGRLYGYDHLPIELPMKSIKPARRDPLIEFKNRLRDLLAKSGANEVLTYSFVNGDLLKKVNQDPSNAYQLANALSPDLQYYRLSLLPSLLEKVHPNLKSDLVRSDDNEFALFEINPVHAKDFLDPAGLPIEDQRLALVFAADDKTAQRKYGGASYYAARVYLTNLLASLGISPVFHPAKHHEPKQPISQAAIAPFDKLRSSVVKTASGEFIGEIGEFSSTTGRNLKLPAFVSGFELDVNQLQKLANPNSNYLPMPRFPKVKQDITLRAPNDLTYGEVFDFVWDYIEKSKPENSMQTLGNPRIYQSPDEPKYKNVTLTLWLSHFDRTLKTEEVNQLLDGVAMAGKDQLKTERV